MLVSIIIPVYNAEYFLKNTLNSVLNQTYQNFEVICINDCSIDNSLSILNSFKEKDERIKIFNLDKNLGCPGLVRNFAVEQSKGELLAFLDADDLWKKDKLKKQLKDLENMNSFFSYTKLENMIGTTVYEPKYYLRIFKNFHIGNLLIDNTITTSTVVMSKALFEKIGRFRDEKMVVSEDYELWIKAVLEAKEIYFLDEILVTYYINPDSITHSTVGYKEIYINIFSIVKKLLSIADLKYILFSVTRIITIPVLFLYHSIIILRGLLKK